MSLYSHTSYLFIRQGFFKTMVVSANSFYQCVILTFLLETSVFIMKFGLQQSPSNFTIIGLGNIFLKKI